MICQQHPNNPVKIVPAGISKKTGKPYNSFQACSIQGCNGPVVPGFETGQMNSPKYAPTPQYVPTQEKKVDWDTLGAQKAMCGMVNAILSTGKDPKEIKEHEVYQLWLRIKAISEPTKAYEEEPPIIEYQ